MASRSIIRRVLAVEALRLVKNPGVFCQFT
jgi:hypothetical protein